MKRSLPIFHDFTAEHAFLFVLRCKKLNVILFTGRLNTLEEEVDLMEHDEL